MLVNYDFKNMNHLHKDFFMKKDRTEPIFYAMYGAAERI